MLEVGDGIVAVGKVDRDAAPVDQPQIKRPTILEQQAAPPDLHGTDLTDMDASRPLGGEHLEHPAVESDERTGTDDLNHEYSLIAPAKIAVSS
jgi:hypothetical protein